MTLPSCVYLCIIFVSVSKAVNSDSESEALNFETISARTAAATGKRVRKYLRAFPSHIVIIMYATHDLELRILALLQYS